MKTSEAVFLIVALVLAAVIGGLIGEVVGAFIPEGSVKTLFTDSIKIGFEATHLQFYAIDFTLGLLVKINFVSVLMVIGVLIYYRWWYI
mgnify:CR=1 FL=1